METAQGGPTTYSVQGVASLTYTKARNYLFDVIIPKVTKFSPVAGLILFLIERETIGFHKDTVRLSIADMINFTNASESSVRRARNYLISEGYVEVIENGTGLNKTHLRFNLFPNGENPVDTPPDSEIIPPPPASVNDIKVISPPDPPPLPANSEDQQARQLESVTDHGDISIDHPPIDRMGHESASQGPITSLDQPPSNEGREVDPIPPEIPAEIPPDNTDRTAENQNQSNENPEKSRAVVQTSPLERPPLAQDLKKTNTEPPEKSPDGDLAKETVKIVLCFFGSIGAELEDRDYKFVWWAVKIYGIDAMKKQIDIMRQQSRRGVKFINPIGRLRFGLTKGYERCKTDRDVWKAKEKRERQRQREEEESRQYRAKLDEVRSEMDDPEVQERMKIRFAEARRALGITS